MVKGGTFPLLFVEEVVIFNAIKSTLETDRSSQGD
jgi:hypothetical protein